MVHASLEDHLDSHCPSCGKEHSKEWTVHLPDAHSQHHFYKKLKCECGYMVFLKLDFMTSGHIDV